MIIETYGMSTGAITFFVIVALLTAVAFITVCASLYDRLLRLGLISTVVFLCGGMILLWSFLTPTHNFENTFENPVNVSTDTSNTIKIDENKFKNKIEKAIDVEAIKIDNSDYSTDYVNRDNLFLTLHNKEFVRFEALRNDKDVSGKVYFTETEMVVVSNVDEKSTNKTTKVPMK